MKKKNVAPLTPAELEANGEKLSSITFNLVYQTFISDYGRFGRDGRTLHIVIYCNDQEACWLEYPIIEVQPDPYTPVFYEEKEWSITNQIRSLMPKYLADAVYQAVEKAYLIATKQDFEGEWEELKREIEEERVQERIEKCQESLAEYEELYKVWSGIKRNRSNNSTLAVNDQVKVLQVIHREVPANLISEFVEHKVAPAEMALRHLVEIGKFPTYDAAKKALTRIRKEIGDITTAHQMSPKKSVRQGTKRPGKKKRLK
jgi:hypothetical protein